MQFFEGQTIRLRLRPDLIVRKQSEGHGIRWAIKDPIALNYFHLRDEEWFLLKRLNGRTSFAEIKATFEESFAPKRVSESHLFSFFSQTHQQGLLISDTTDQGRVLMERAQRNRNRSFFRGLANPLAIRLPGFDADRIITFWFRAGSLAFQFSTVAFFFLLLLATAVLFIGQSDEIRDRLAQHHDFFNGANVFSMVIALAGVKCLHELGHATACRRFGAECREIGVMFLVFTPCLYCNVSDAWMLSDKWRRIAISTAGIYVELMLGSVAALLWYFSEPGVVNSFFLNIVVLCTVNTLLLNGNPLLRYDGYYILSDLVEIPNLAEQSRTAISSRIRRFFFFDASRIPAHSGSLWFLMSYGVLSAAYRVLVVFVILWGVYHSLKPFGLEVVAVVFAMSVIVGRAAPPFSQMMKNMRIEKRKRFDRFRAGMFLMVVFLLIVFSVFVPLPRSIRVPIVLEFGPALHVSAPRDGTLSPLVTYGESVESGQPIARLEDPALQKERLDAAGKAQLLSQQLVNLRFQANAAPDLLTQIPPLEASLHDILNRQKKIEDKIEQLKILAPVGGIVLRPTFDMANDPQQDESPLMPLDHQNVGASIDRGDLICVIGKRAEQRVRALISENDVDLVQLQAIAKMRFNQNLTNSFVGKVTAVSSEAVENVPPPFANSKLILVKPSAKGKSVPEQPCYYVTVSLQANDELLRHGASGTARIELAPTPLAPRLTRTLSRLFRFDL